MIQIGEYQSLTVVREMPQGFYLEDEDENEVLFPRKYITPDMEIDDRIKAFVYCDSSGREVATTEKPLFTVGQCALLEVVQVNDSGAFCEWGITKELFIPYSNQDEKLVKGNKYVVYMYLDDVTERLVGTTKLDVFLKKFADDNITVGSSVNIRVFKELDKSYKVVINDAYVAMIYKNEIKEPLRIGQLITGYIKPLRPDNKIDVSINPVGHQHIEPQAQLILTKLKSNGGHLPYNDKSKPEDIKAVFGISKKLFKKCTGNLYKQRLIAIKDDGIHLLQS